MNITKTDTERSSLMSDEETNSETIDDFSQCSTATRDNNFQELNFHSSLNTPASKSISVKINQNDEHLKDTQYDELLLNDGTDNMDDVMIQISKRTTVKKIITKTTSVNGVTQANETESFFKDSQVNDTVVDSGMKSDRSPKSTNLSKHMEDSQEAVVEKESAKYNGNQQVRSPDNSLSDVDQIKTCEPSKTTSLERIHKKDNGTNPITPRVNHSYQNTENREIEIKTLPSPINVEKKSVSNADHKKINRSETFDMKDYRSENKDMLNQRRPHIDPISRHLPGTYSKSHKEPSTNKSKHSHRKESGKYIHEPEKAIKANKDEPDLDMHTGHSQQEHSTIPNQMKWVDPLKSCHLKYDLRNNSRSLQHWIREKSNSLRNSAPSFQVKDRIYKNTSNTAPKPNALSKAKNTHKDTKQFIIRGNLRENSFENRHSLSRPVTLENPDQRRHNVPQLSRTNKLQTRSYKSMENINEMRTDKSFSKYDNKNKDLTSQVSKILNKFELNNQKRSVKRTNFGVPHHCSVRCGHENVCCPNHCPSLHMHCHQCCWSFYNFPSQTENNLSVNRKCFSYQNLNSLSLSTGRMLPDTYHATNNEGSEDDSSIQNTEIIENLEHNNINNYDSKYFSSQEKHIDFLERKLSSMENKIRNLHANGPTRKYHRENDLEKQCRDIERQLVYTKQKAF